MKMVIQLLLSKQELRLKLFRVLQKTRTMVVEQVQTCYHLITMQLTKMLKIFTGLLKPKHLTVMLLIVRKHTYQTSTIGDSVLMTF